MKIYSNYRINARRKITADREDPVERLLEMAKSRDSMSEIDSYYKTMVSLRDRSFANQVVMNALNEAGFFESVIALYRRDPEEFGDALEDEEVFLAIVDALDGGNSYNKRIYNIATLLSVDDDLFNEAYSRFLRAVS